MELVTDTDAPPAASKGSDDSNALMVVLGVGALSALTAGALYARRRWVR